eukprot:6943483-Prymnesium_polylepis.1
MAARARGVWAEPPSPATENKCSREPPLETRLSPLVVLTLFGPCPILDRVERTPRRPAAATPSGSSPTAGSVRLTTRSRGHSSSSRHRSVEQRERGPHRLQKCTFLHAVARYVRVRALRVHAHPAHLVMHIKPDLVLPSRRCGGAQDSARHRVVGIPPFQPPSSIGLSGPPAQGRPALLQIDWPGKIDAILGERDANASMRRLAYRENGKERCVSYGIKLHVPEVKVDKPWRYALDEERLPPAPRFHAICRCRALDIPPASHRLLQEIGASIEVIRTLESHERKAPVEVTQRPVEHSLPKRDPCQPSLGAAGRIRLIDGDLRPCPPCR